MLSQTIFTEPELKQLCKEWQEILGLQAWYIKTEIKRAADFTKKSKSAEISWVLSRKEAHIKALNPVDYPPDCILPQDMEVDIVHELLHISVGYFDETKRDSLEEIMVEQHIDTVSKALVRLKRRDNPQIKNFAIKGEGLT